MTCDRCPATAAVETILDTGLPLSFCLHHYREYEEALIPYVVSTCYLRAKVTQ